MTISMTHPKAATSGAVAVRGPRKAEPGHLPPLPSIATGELLSYAAAFGTDTAHG